LKIRAGNLWQGSCTPTMQQSWSPNLTEAPMFAIHVESLGDLSIIECRGRITRSDSVFRLRDVVQEQTANTIALDLSEVEAIGGGGLGILAFLER
jgi:hypothetical protein